MIRRLSIENFRCIRKAEIELGPFTVLVGPNASGKTTVLEALRPSIHHDQKNHWRQESAAQAKLVAHLYDGRSSGYESRIPTKSSVPVKWLTQSVHHVRLDIDALRAENTVARATLLSETGDNLANVIGSLTRKQQEHLSRMFCRLVPVFADVDLQPTSGGRHELRFQDRWSEKLWYQPSQVSDGTMLMLAYLTLQYQATPVDVLTIEEPDRGLHPYLMEQVISFFRRLSSPSDPAEKPIQIVAATHSAELLEYCRPEEVRFLDRTPEDGALRVHQIDTASPDWEETFETYRRSLGSVWLSGGVGGVPGR